MFIIAGTFQFFFLHKSPQTPPGSSTKNTMKLFHQSNSNCQFIELIHLKINSSNYSLIEQRTLIISPDYFQELQKTHLVRSTYKLEMKRAQEKNVRKDEENGKILVTRGTTRYRMK